MLSVAEGEDSEFLWLLAPEGTVMTRDVELEPVEIREATGNDRALVQTTAERVVGQIAVQISEVSYGIAPPGLQQAVPEGLPAPGLVSGRKYVVTAVGVGDIAFAEFSV
jgi:hypothetical protein